ncbi:MAG: pilus assembly protein [Nitrospirota bacterium]|nr:pilus assembly protein [Nitrospirota bacterium]
MSPIPHERLTSEGKKKNPSQESFLSNERGVTAVLVAIVIVTLIAMASFSVDLGFAWVTKNELQNIADAAALAGSQQLGVVYAALPPNQKEDLTRSLTSSEQAQVLNFVGQVAGLNRAGGLSGIAIDTASDVSIGTWDFATKTLTPTLVRPTAVTVTARRDGNVNGPISTFFANVMGISEINVAATATAALGPLGFVPPGTANFPVGISKRWFDEGHDCGDSIKFHPTGTLDGCAGWHTFTTSPANANSLRTILTDLKDGSYVSPAITAGQTQLEFTGGTVASVFDEMKALYDANKDPVTGTWDVKIPVYDSDDCGNPGGAITIVGFATATVTEVLEAPEKQIMAKVTCDKILDGRPGGTMVNGGMSPLSTIPALVS